VFHCRGRYCNSPSDSRSHIRPSSYNGKSINPMNEEFTIAQQVAELRGITVEGFKAVNNHLTELNGKVAAHERRLNDDAISKAEERGMKKASAKTWATILGIATVIGGAIGGVIELI